MMRRNPITNRDGGMPLGRFLAGVSALLFAGLLPQACNQAASDRSPAATDLAGSPSEVPSGPGYFDDMTAQAGLSFSYRNGEEAGHYTLLETLGGGVALIDFDGDGLLDIFLTGGGHFGPNREILGYPCKLYHNRGNWQFRDVTAAVGLERIDFCTHGAAVGDYDNDGWPDLLVTGYGRMALFHNQRGRFEDVTAAAGLAKDKQTHWSTSAAWADFDRDGRLDLFVAHYVDWSMQKHFVCLGHRQGQDKDVCSPKQFEPLLPRLYFNSGKGTFRTAPPEAGLEPAKALGVLVLDLDEDGWNDIYVANDTVDNQLYLNQHDGSFTGAAVARGVAGSENGAAEGSMGVDAADYDGTGHLSLLVANYQGEAHALYRHSGQGRFKHHSSRAGLRALGSAFVGFGTGFVDFDNDGAEDIFFSNGHVLRHPPDPSTVAQRPVLLRNSRTPEDKPAAVCFRDVSLSGGKYFQSLHRGRGTAFGDLDNDGWIDLVISHVNEPVTLLRNVGRPGRHWLGVALAASDAELIGARLELEANGQRLVRAIKGGGSYLSANDRRIVFGLGSSPPQTARLTIHYPSGRVQTVDQLPLDAYTKVALTR